MVRGGLLLSVVFCLGFGFMVWRLAPAFSGANFCFLWSVVVFCFSVVFCLGFRFVVWRLANETVQKIFSSCLRAGFLQFPFGASIRHFLCIVGCFCGGSVQHLFPHLLIQRCSSLAPTHLGGSLLSTCLRPHHKEGNPRRVKFFVRECPKCGLCNRDTALHPHLIP